MPTAVYKRLGGEYLIQIYALPGYDEHQIAMTWLYSTLAGDATVTNLVSTRIYEGTAPETAALIASGTTLRFLTYNPTRAGQDDRTYGLGHPRATLIMLITGWLQAEAFDDLFALSARLRVLLDVSDVPVLDGATPMGTIEKAHRLMPFALTEVYE